MISTHDTAVVRQVAAVLLGYPGERQDRRLGLVSGAIAELDDTAAKHHLWTAYRFVRDTPALDLAAQYVETFDRARRRTLHMTYYTDGDTRRRGHHLARIKEIYTDAGWRCDPAELPDHLCLLLEFAARGDTDAGQRLLLRFQPGVELLRAALRDHGDAYAAVLEAVAATLPSPDEAARAEVLRAARQGPPAEDVGLNGYGGATALGMPALRPVAKAGEDR
ncbi:MAG: nitrate reductase molybdenum cofactor assembly chaperone [Stackebrandtia sp.]